MIRISSISHQTRQPGILSRRTRLICFTLLAMILCAPSPAGAATINVTANAPDVFIGGDGSCSLREAITNINNAFNSSPDCIATGQPYGTSDTINLPTGTYTNAIINPVAAEEDFNANGDLDIRKSVAIIGAGATTTVINANGFVTSDRVLDIDPQGVAGVIVSISGVTIRNGATLFDGGGIRHQGTLTITNSTISNNSAQFGGGIAQQGVLVIMNSTISGNIATSGGGGIFTTSGLVKITNSTISGNTAAVMGGGINVYAGSLTIITNSTISGNAAGTVFAGGSTGSGSAIMNFGVTTITNSTITGNTNEGINNNTGGTLSLKNTIVAKQGFGADCTNAGGTILTLLNNVVGSGNCGVVPTPNPLLGPLQNNGGPTLTHALLPGSPAIDAGDAATCATIPVNGLDQRGIARPQGAGCDIGAFELEVAPPPSPPSPPPIVTLTNSFTITTGGLFTLTARVTPGLLAGTPVDAYAEYTLPGGQVFYQRLDGTFSQTTPAPLITNWPLAPVSGTLFSFAFTGAEPPGVYSVRVFFYEPGTMTPVGNTATTFVIFFP